MTHTVSVILNKQSILPAMGAILYEEKNFRFIVVKISQKKVFTLS